MSEPLAVLACSGCGEPLAVGEADWIACPACGKREIVPEPYRALRDAEQATAADRAQVAHFYRKLGRSSRFTSWLVDGVDDGVAIRRLTSFYMASMIALVLSPIVLLIVIWWLVALEPRVNVYQVLDPALRGVVYGGAVFAALLVPALGFWRLGWVRGRRRVMLRRALAAGAPARAGGPATCRACGAPLSISPGAIAVGCLYCRAENLLVPRGDILASRETKVMTLDQVIAEEAFQRRKEKRGLTMALLVPVIAGMLVLLAMWLVAGHEYRWDESGSLRCQERTCTQWQNVRLERGRVAHVDLDGTAGGPPKIHLDGQAITPLPSEWSSVATASVDDHGRATLVAPWTGWFRVVVEVPGPADAMLRVDP